MESKGGFDPGMEISRKTVFAAVLSAVRSEYYLAAQAGKKADIVFKIHAAEYGDENRAEHEGKRYLIDREYAKPRGEFLELVCSDLSGRT